MCRTVPGRHSGVWLTSSTRSVRGWGRPGSG
jgi:hypothetical protein